MIISKLGYLFEKDEAAIKKKYKSVTVAKEYEDELYMVGIKNFWCQQQRKSKCQLNILAKLEEIGFILEMDTFYISS
jgi:hypothetical protein